MRKYKWALLLAAMMAVAAIPAFAVDGTTPIDYSTAMPTITTSLQVLLANAGVPLLGVLVVMLGFGLVWRLLKKAAKAV